MNVTNLKRLREFSVNSYTEDLTGAARAPACRSARSLARFADERRRRGRVGGAGALSDRAHSLYHAIVWPGAFSRAPRVARAETARALFGEQRL